MNNDASPTKKRKLSPILHQILHGGPSITLNVSRITRTLTNGATFFQTRGLNRCIMFKYPNFEVEISGENSTDYDNKDATLSHERPIETALYIPNDEEFPQDGGYAIYLRQKNSEELLKRHVGISGDNASDAMKNDIIKLRMIDNIPSLDPFLLKTAFEGEKININPAYLGMKGSEEDSIKRVISQKVRPIIDKALGTNDKDVGGRSQRFIDAIWDPDNPKPALFIQSFKIEKSEVADVFSAWKGVSFYQHQFGQNRAQIAEILKWFKSDLSTPIDIREHKHFAEQQNMYKASINAKILNVISNINQIFRDFDGCYEKFIGAGDPIPFRNFLMTLHHRYWTLGYCCTSLVHCRNIFDRSIEEGARGQLKFEQMNEMLTRMNASLSSKSSGVPEIG